MFSNERVHFWIGRPLCIWYHLLRRPMVFTQFHVFIQFFLFFYDHCDSSPVKIHVECILRTKRKTERANIELNQQKKQLNSVKCSQLRFRMPHLASNDEHHRVTSLAATSLSFWNHFAKWRHKYIFFDVSHSTRVKRIENDGVLHFI